MMSDHCPIKTLVLSGVFSGSHNVEVSVASNQSIALIGVDDAVIDGNNADWLLSVVGNGSLELTNITLQHAFLPEGSPRWGAALSVVGQGTVRATGVMFRGNKAVDPGARGGAVSLLDSAANPVRWLNAHFIGCTWDGNKAGKGVTRSSGGGIYTASACPSFVGCTWRYNDGWYGGGLQLDTGTLAAAAAAGAPQPALVDCVFEFNSAATRGTGGGGGARVNYASPSFVRCIWRSNVAGFEGGGLVLNSPTGENPSASAPSFLNCTFVRNKAPNAGGGAIYATEAAGLRFVGVIFEQNEAGLADSGGGAILFEATAANQTLLYFEGCLFDSNRAAGIGGALSLIVYPKVAMADDDAGATPVVCTFLGTQFMNNSAAGAGGAVAAAFPPDTPANLRFLHDNCSGVVCSDPTSPSDNTPPDLFASNTARSWTRSVVLQLANVAFRGNSAGTNGGALTVANGAVAMVNATMEANSVGGYGGALYLDGTASLSASETTWVLNIVKQLALGSSTDGQHVYAAAGAGAWRFSGNTTFEHADAKEDGLSAAKTDGADGLVMETNQESVLTIICPAGAVATPLSQRVSKFTAKSDEWRLGPGVITTTTTAAFANVSFRPTCDGVAAPPGQPAFCQLPSAITARNSTLCEAQYFANWSCGNPPPVYPPMLYTTISLGCKQCDRSDVALPAGTQRGSSANSSQCERCPAAWVGNGSAKCDSGHVVQAAGWWRPEDDGAITKSTRFWECYTHEAACLGSANTTAGAPPFGAQCAPGHTGPVCALCLPGFAMEHSKCKLCPPGAWGVVGSALAVALFMIVCCVALYYNRRKLGIAGRMSSIKIVVGFYSLLAVVEQTFAIAWPAGFERVLSVVKVAFASVLDLSAFSCAVKIDWFHKVGFWCLLLVTTLLVVAIAFAAAVHKANSRGDDQVVAPARITRSACDLLVGKLFGENRPQALEVEYSGKAFYAMLLVYPFLSPAAVAVFDCRELAGAWYLQADVSLHCFDSQWVFWAVISALICAFYVAGLPCIAFYSVIHRGAFTAFVSEGYRTDGGRICLGWEVVEMVRKLLLTSAVIFWNKGSCMQIAVAMLVSMFFLAFHMLHMPYETRMDNWLQVLALVGLLLVYIMGLLIKVQPDLESQYGFDLLLQIVSAVVGMLLFAVAFVHKAGLLWRRKKKTGKWRYRFSNNTSAQMADEMLEPFVHQESGGQNQDNSHLHLHELQALREEHASVQDQNQHEKEERKREQEEHAAALRRLQDQLKWHEQQAKMVNNRKIED
jgi:predicted outer membrane repeat protein